MNPRPFPFWPIFLVSLNILAIFSGALYLYQTSSQDLPAEELRILRLVHHQILAEHVQEHDSGELVERAIRSMVSGLDRHSRFISEKEVKGFEADEITGTYEGIGILIVANHSPATIRFPLDGGPAEAAGLRAGDHIVAVDGHDISGVAADKVIETAIKLIKGPSGTKVKLKIERGGEDPFEVDVDRSDVRQPAVKWARFVDAEQALGYVHIADFQQGMVEQFDRAIEGLKAASSGSLNGLILDLRFNPGGLLGEAIALSNRFVKEGPIVVLKRRGGEIVDQHEADPKLCSLPDLPVVILLNEYSASASEVVSGCLQDYAIAQIVGVRSYGKGVVQSIYQWGDLPFRLKLTTSHYYTPKGRSIEARMRREEDGDAEGGLTPDLEAKVRKKETRLIQGALDGFEVPAAHARAARILSETLKINFPSPLPPAEDTQLGAGIEALRVMIKAAKIKGAMIKGNEIKGNEAATAGSKAAGESGR